MSERPNGKEKEEKKTWRIFVAVYYSYVTALGSVGLGMYIDKHRLAVLSSSTDSSLSMFTLSNSKAATVFSAHF